MSVQSQIDRLNAIKQRIRTNLVAQGIAVPEDTMLEEMATQILSVAGEDGTSVTVKSVSESTADGGVNVVTFSDGKTLTVKNGSKGSSGTNGTNGKDGKTPVKGTDYWTDADQESIVQQVIVALGTPVFGRVDADNNIILTGELADGEYTIKYEDADGNVTEIGTLDTDPGPSYTNWIPKATDTSGAIYNGTGYKTGVRYSASSGAESTSNASAITLSGFIPAKAGDVIRIKNITLKRTSSVGNAHHICYFPSLSLSGGAAKDMATATDWQPVWDSNSQMVQCTIPSNLSVQYIRVQAEYIGADSILTINEPIE